MSQIKKILPTIFSDATLDEEVRNKQELLYDSIAYKRRIRYTDAMNEWMKDFPTEPLPFKNSLEFQISSLENLPDLPPIVIEKLNKLKNQLQSGEYCDGTNAHALYRGAYEDRKLAFIWPSQQESELRQQEEAQLLAQINK